MNIVSTVAHIYIELFTSLFINFIICYVCDNVSCIPWCLMFSKFHEHMCNCAKERLVLVHVIRYILYLIVLFIYYLMLGTSVSYKVSPLSVNMSYFRT